MVATAQVGMQDGTFIERIDLIPTPGTLRRLCEEFEDIVTSQLFSLLNEFEDKIEALHLKIVFEDGSEAALAEVQTYLSSDKGSLFPSLRRFRVKQRHRGRPGANID